MIEGSFKSRYNSDQYEFKISRLHLLETVKSSLTKQLVIDVAPQFIDDEFVNFIDANVKSHPGKQTIRFHINDTDKQLKVSMYTMEKGFTMNDEMAVYLNEHTNLDVSVTTA